MERFCKKEILVKIICIAVLLAYGTVLIGIPWISSLIRLNELSKLSYYVVYDRYAMSTFTDYDMFEVYVMVNEKKDEMSVEDKVKSLITEDFLGEMRNVPTENPDKGNLYEKYGEHDLKVFYMFPTKDLPYGWERGYASNMEIPYDHTIKATLEIPISADSTNDCVLEFWE